MNQSFKYIEYYRKKRQCLFFSGLESVSAIVADSFAHGQTAQDTDRKEEYGQEDGTAAVVVDKHTGSAVGAIAHATNYDHRWARLHDHLWLIFKKSNNISLKFKIRAFLCEVSYLAGAGRTDRRAVAVGTRLAAADSHPVAAGTDNSGSGTAAAPSCRYTPCLNIYLYIHKT
jgi:hypothetical protein